MKLFKDFFTFESMSFKIVMFFAVIGATLTAIAIHELMHKADYDRLEIDRTKETICILNYPTTIKSALDLNVAIGYYDVDYTNKGNFTAQEQKILDRTEMKAYFVTTFIIEIFFVAWGYVVIWRYRKKDDEAIIEVIKEEVEKLGE